MYPKIYYWRYNTYTCIYNYMLYFHMQDAIPCLKLFNKHTHTGNAAKIISEVGEITDTKLHPESYLKDLPSCKTNNAFQQFSRDKCLTSVVLPLIVSFSLLIAADSSRRQHPLPTLCCLWTLVIVTNDPVNKGYLCLNGLNWKQHLLL